MTKKRFIKRFRSFKYCKEEIQSCTDFMKGHNGFISYSSLLIFIICVHKGDITTTLEDLEEFTSYSNNMSVSFTKCYEAKND